MWKIGGRGTLGGIFPLPNLLLRHRALLLHHHSLHEGVPLRPVSVGRCRVGEGRKGASGSGRQVGKRTGAKPADTVHVPAGRVGGQDRNTGGLRHLHHGPVVRIVVLPGTSAGLELVFRDEVLEVLIHDPLDVPLEHLQGKSHRTKDTGLFPGTSQREGFPEEFRFDPMAYRVSVGFPYQNRVHAGHRLNNVLQ